MRTLFGIGMLLTLGPAFAAGASAPPEAESGMAQRPPQVSVEFGGSLGRMRHPTAYMLDWRNETSMLGARASSTRLSGGLHFNMVRSSGRSDWWWTNGVDWYLTGDELQVLSVRPGFEKRFTLTGKLLLGLNLYGAASEVSLASGRMFATVPPDGTANPDPDSAFFQRRVRKWTFGGGGSAALHYQLSRWVHTRVNVGYTQYVKQAKSFGMVADTAPDTFSVSLSGPWAAAYVGVDL
ncbi:hypothetical protein [Myxococcus qinghaiensis]|uniref:hypothetical protein n=1 Tax=Myxococcus qinghaiensis TaxID=2906758 RepID=UPI0020A7B0D0|nr:hypothetical protein [Myxococcus qinghaiensis]MCP3169735.1 hypothetical protein [Myxococcus qinghaiensis]